MSAEASDPGPMGVALSLEERRVAAFEAMANNLGSLAHVMGLRYELELRRYGREYPEKREARDAVVTHPQTDEEKLREAQGDTGEKSNEEWAGRRESAFNQAQARRAAKTARS